MKETLGTASLLLAIIGFIPYLIDIFKMKTKPHAFSWLVWAVLSVIAFAVQITNNGGPGSWLNGMTAIITFSIFLLSLKYGEKNILTVDWLSLLFAAFALVLWFITKDPLISVILISLIDAVGGFFPTFRKSISNPYEETAILYLIYAASLTLSLAALTTFSLVNALYPASFVVINLAMASFLFVRRRTIGFAR